MLARGTRSESSRKGHNFCLTAKTGEKMNGKEKGHSYVKADIVEKCFCDTLEENVHYT